MGAEKQFAGTGNGAGGHCRKFLRVRGSTGGRGPLGQPGILDPCPLPTPVNQEIRQQGSGGCFYGDDLTEGMVRTKPGTIHTYIYYIQRRSPPDGWVGWPLAQAAGSGPAHPVPPPPSAGVKCVGPGLRRPAPSGDGGTSGDRKGWGGDKKY